MNSTQKPLEYLGINPWQGKLCQFLFYFFLFAIAAYGLSIRENISSGMWIVWIVACFLLYLGVMYLPFLLFEIIFRTPKQYAGYKFLKDKILHNEIHVGFALKPSSVKHTYIVADAKLNVIYINKKRYDLDKIKKIEWNISGIHQSLSLIFSSGNNPIVRVPVEKSVRQEFERLSNYLNF